MERKLPIGIQDFIGLREDSYIYVDKTKYIYNLVHTGKQYFLSRPRRFGKSLLLSTMKAYWEGKKELFKGLDIEILEKNSAFPWKQHPVFCFDFNTSNYEEWDALERRLNFQLGNWEEMYHIHSEENTLPERFQKLLMTAANQTGLRCVVLVDEYDKPLLEASGKPEILEHNKAVFKGFFSTLKSYDAYIQFVFITGVTKFHKVSIFSDMNQLNDISLNEDYASVCGITEQEITEFFAPEVTGMAVRQKQTEQECLHALKVHYDGYHFAPECPGVYNPFSLLKAFYEKRYGSYWFETGTPSFLVRRLKNIGFDVRSFLDQTIYASENTLKDYTGENSDPIPLLYQTGYLTIADYDPTGGMYTLAFPNEEVKYGFLESLMPEYVSRYGPGTGKDIFTLRKYIETGNLEGIHHVLTALFASINYSRQSDPFEHYFQAVIQLTFTLLGKFARCEVHTATGRIDCTVETQEYIYLFEFKRDESADTALAQIEQKHYALPYAADPRKLYRIGVSFSSDTRLLTDWKVAE